METYECKVCGYVYSPATGDKENGIAPGTDFSQISDEWRCPICNSKKSYFKKQTAENGFQK